MLPGTLCRACATSAAGCRAPVAQRSTNAAGGARSPPQAPPPPRRAHVVNEVVQAVAHGARQHVHLAAAAVGAVQLDALDDAVEEASHALDAVKVGLAQPRHHALRLLVLHLCAQHTQGKAGRVNRRAGLNCRGQWEGPTTAQRLQRASRHRGRKAGAAPSHQCILLPTRRVTFTSQCPLMHVFTPPHTPPAPPLRPPSKQPPRPGPRRAPPLTLQLVQDPVLNVCTPDVAAVKDAVQLLLQQRGRGRGGPLRWGRWLPATERARCCAAHAGQPAATKAGQQDAPSSCHRRRGRGSATGTWRGHATCRGARGCAGGRRCGCGSGSGSLRGREGESAAVTPERGGDAWSPARRVSGAGGG